MKETILKKYFEMLITAEELDQDIEGSQVKTGYDTSRLDIEIIIDKEEFIVTSKHLIQLAEDTISNKISLPNLATLAFALEGSDFYNWDNETEDGKKVARVLFEWDNESINYPINIQNLKLWSKFLETGQHKLIRSNGI